MLCMNTMAKLRIVLLLGFNPMKPYLRHGIKVIKSSPFRDKLGLKCLPNCHQSVPENFGDGIDRFRSPSAHRFFEKSIYTHADYCCLLVLAPLHTLNLFPREKPPPFAIILGKSGKELLSQASYVRTWIRIPAGERISSSQLTDNQRNGSSTTSMRGTRRP